MGGAIELWEQRIKLAKKARSAAKDLANDLPPQEGRSKRFKTAYYLLSIDALAWMYMRTSRAEEAIGILEKILVEIETDFIERPNTKALCLIFLARAYLLIENINIDEASKKLADVDVKKITNHLVRIRFLMIQGDIFIKTDSVMAAISVYEEAIAIQAQLGIDFNSSGLSYRIGKAYVDEAKNLPTESSEKTVYLEKAKKIFIDIDEVERDSIDKYYALCGLAQITALEESYKEALKKAEEVRKMYWERFERIEHTDKRPHLLLNYIDDFIKELRVLTDN
jgi:tetratricopeptide (TPR) repeat protein